MITRRKIPSKIELAIGDQKLKIACELARLTGGSNISHVVNKCNTVINLLKSIAKTKWDIDKSSMLLLCNV